MGKKKKNAKSKNRRNGSTKKRTIFKTIWAIIWDKEDTGDWHTKGIFSILLSTTLIAVAFLLALSSIILPFKVGASLPWTSQELLVSNIKTMTLTILFTFCMCLFGVMLKGCANEIRRTEDTTQIVNIFSAVVSLAALIVALVALVQGVS